MEDPNTVTLLHWETLWSLSKSSGLPLGPVGANVKDEVSEAGGDWER